MTDAIAPISDLFQRAWARFWDNLGTLVIISVLLSGISLLVSYVLGGADSLKSTLGIGPAPEDFNLYGWGRTILLGGSVTILAGIANMLGTGLMIARLHWPKKSLGSLIIDIRSYAWKLIAANLLSGLAIFAGALLLIIPGIVLGLMLIFSEYAVVIEGKGALESLKQSRTLGQGRLWPVFIRLLAYFIVIIIITIAVQNIPFGVIATGAFLSPFGTVFIYELYLSLRATKTLTPNS